MATFRVVTGGEGRSLVRRVVWYVERRTDDGHLGIVGLLYEKKGDAEAVAKNLNDQEPDSYA
jgi:hypothetical protein